MWFRGRKCWRRSWPRYPAALTRDFPQQPEFASGRKRLHSLSYPHLPSACPLNCFSGLHAVLSLIFVGYYERQKFCFPSSVLGSVWKTSEFSTQVWAQQIEWARSTFRSNFLPHHPVSSSKQGKGLPSLLLFISSLGSACTDSVMSPCSQPMGYLSQT